MFSFNSFLARCEIGREFEELEKKLKSAKVLGKKECVKCGFCCHRRTCIPTPTELKIIAEFLKMTPKDLINKFFAIDKRNGSSSFFLKPIGVNIQDLAGKFIPADRTFDEGKCIFLGEDNNCKIYPVRPMSAKIQKCWDNKDLSDREKYMEELMDSWENDAIKEFGIENVDESEEEEEED